MDNTMNNAPVQKQGIKISKVLQLMKDGYARTSDSKSYNPEIGSVQEFFSLSDHEVKHLFSFSKLKNAKTSVAKPINFYIEMEDEEVDPMMFKKVIEPTMNEILDNMVESGVESLTLEDKRLLEKYANEYK